MDPAMRGMYIVSTSGCNDCHTPWVFNKDLGMPVPDMTRMLSGHPAGEADSATKINPKTDLALIGGDFTSFTLPFGIVYSANLTPDKETGLGNWTEEMFVKAMRTGMHLGAEGRPNPAAHAVARVPQLHGRGPQGDLRLSQVDPRDSQPGGRPEGAEARRRRPHEDAPASSSRCSTPRTPTTALRPPVRAAAAPARRAREEVARQSLRARSRCAGVPSATLTLVVVRTPAPWPSAGSCHSSSVYSPGGTSLIVNAPRSSVTAKYGWSKT